VEEFQENKISYTEHISLWAQSGLNKTAYCKQHGLKYSNFMYYYLRLSKNELADLGFDKLVFKNTSGMIRFYKANGNYFEFDATISVQIINQLCE